jgi:hypothetical protein
MEWKDKIGSFKQIDVRGIQGNFFQGIKKHETHQDGTSAYTGISRRDGGCIMEVML